MRSSPHKLGQSRLPCYGPRQLDLFVLDPERLAVERVLSCAALVGHTESRAVLIGITESRAALIGLAERVLCRTHLPCPMLHTAQSSRDLDQ